MVRKGEFFPLITVHHHKGPQGNISARAEGVGHCAKLQLTVPLRPSPPLPACNPSKSEVLEGILHDQCCGTCTTGLWGFRIIGGETTKRKVWEATMSGSHCSHDVRGQGGRGLLWCRHSPDDDNWTD